MDLVYQEIWDADQGGNGLPAVRPDDDRSAARGFVVVDERDTDTGADHRVVSDVVIPEDRRETYCLCRRLFDNYALSRSAPEFVRSEETQEELDFIEAVLETPPIQVAQHVLSERLELTVTKDLMAAFVKETWFKIGPAGNQPDASGFEHVFIGEQGRQATKAGGYHYWHKYFLDDGAHGTDQIQYHGTRYGHAEQPGKGILVPEVVTLSMVWDAPAGDGPGAGRSLSKGIGGFFVGCSPEGLIALGLVRCRTPSDKLTKINGAVYQLDLHRLNGEPNSIRTFFPRFIKADLIDIEDGKDGPSDDGGGGGTPDGGSDTFRIVAAMVNPVNPEGGREFLQIINTSNRAASLLRWKVVAPNGTTLELADNTVPPGEIVRIQVPGRQGILRNKSGDIRLLDSEGRGAQVCSYTTEQARKEGAPILFA